MPKPRLIAIIGPTAVGKTDYGVEMAQRLNGSVVSADSRQVYRGMDIGTGTPLRQGFAGQEVHNPAIPDFVEGIPHYLLNIREPNQPMTLPEWQEAAFAAIDMILAEGRQPILVGGTMLYVDSIVRNYDIPHVKPDEAFRERKMKKEKRNLYQELLEKDPGAGKFIEQGNTRRIIRALEVMAATGKPFSLQRVQGKQRYDVKIIGLFPGGGPPFRRAGWTILRNNIESRARAMFEEGLLEETQKLRERYGKDLPLLKTLNYLQAGKVLDNVMTQEEAIADMVKSGMRYAHRQMSWWKGRDEIRWIQTPPPAESGKPPLLKGRKSA